MLGKKKNCVVCEVLTCDDSLANVISRRTICEVKALDKLYAAKLLPRARARA